MEYTKLGSSALNVSRIGLGCMSLQPGAPESIPVIHEALELGINFLDTADLYDRGYNEEMVGRALQGKRTEVILATKVGNRLRPDGKSWDWDASGDYIRKAVEESLRRLGTDYIDLYQLHGGTLADPIDETIAAFEQLRQAGKIRYYGISSIRPNVIREWIKKSSMVSVMMQYSLLDQRPAEECLDLLHGAGISVIARGALAQGLLINKTSKEYLQRPRHEVELARNLVHRISEQGRTATQTALQFVLHHPAIASVITGVSSASQLAESASVFSAAALSSEEYSFLLTHMPANFYTDHR